MASQQTKCLICNRSCGVKSSRSDADKEIDIAANLEVILIVRKVLELPAEVCQSFLKHGNPSEWGVAVCTTCRVTYVDKAQAVSVQITGLKMELNGILEEVVTKIKTRVDEENGIGGLSKPKTKGRPKRKGKNDISPVASQICDWIVAHRKDKPVLKKPEDYKEIDERIRMGMQMEHTAKAFQTLGTGYKLSGEPQPGPSSSCSGSVAVTSRQEVTLSASLKADEAASNLANLVSDQKRAAAAAALARFEKNRKPDADSNEMLASRQAAFIKEQARKELEKETLDSNNAGINGEGQNLNGHGSEVSSTSVSVSATPRVIDPEDYAVQGVYFRNSFAGIGLLPKSEVEAKIQEYLFKQLKANKEINSCRLIHSCNKPLQKVTACVDTLTSYLTNIIQHPTEDKYRQIKFCNMAYQNKVGCVIGAEEFLKAAGFKKTRVAKGGFDEYEMVKAWIWSNEKDHSDDDEENEEDHDDDDVVREVPTLIKMRDMLKSTVAIKPELDRNVQVIKASALQKRSEFPDEFYTLSREEVKRQQMLKTEKVELESTLRTKEMRARDELQEQRMYRYGVMRVRFPDGLILQGTFRATETLEDLFTFVRENLVMDDLSFTLIKPPVENLDDSDMNATLAALRLTPASIFSFQPSNPPSALSSGEVSYLHPDVLKLVE